MWTKLAPMAGSTMLFSWSAGVWDRYISVDPDELARLRPGRQWIHFSNRMIDGWSLDIGTPNTAPSSWLKKSGWQWLLFSRVEIEIYAPSMTPLFADATTATTDGRTMGGLIRKSIVEIEPDQLRKIGLAEFEFRFKPLLAFALKRKKNL